MTGLELQRKIQTAGVWFTGVFMGEFLKRYPDYSCDIERRTAFIQYIHEEYGKNLDYTFDSTKTKCYALMSIIEAGRTIDALDIVSQNDDIRVPDEARENASETLTALLTGKLSLPR